MGDGEKKGKKQLIVLIIYYLKLAPDQVLPMTMTVEKRSRSRGRSPRKADSSDDERSEPGHLKAERRAIPRPERPNSPSKEPPPSEDRKDEDDDEQKCPVCSQKIRGGRVGMKMHSENSTYHRQFELCGLEDLVGRKLGSVPNLN